MSWLKPPAFIQKPHAPPTSIPLTRGFALVWIVQGVIVAVPLTILGGIGLTIRRVFFHAADWFPALAWIYVVLIAILSFAIGLIFATGSYLEAKAKMESTEEKNNNL